MSGYGCGIAGKKGRETEEKIGKKKKRNEKKMLKREASRERER